MGKWDDEKKIPKSHCPIVKKKERGRNRPLITLNPISCQKGAECYTRQKCRRWVVLGVRPIDGIFC